MIVQVSRSHFHRVFWLHSDSVTWTRGPCCLLYVRSGTSYLVFPVLVSQVPGVSYCFNHPVMINSKQTCCKLQVILRASGPVQSIPCLVPFFERVLDSCLFQLVPVPVKLVRIIHCLSSALSRAGCLLIAVTPEAFQ